FLVKPRGAHHAGPRLIFVAPGAGHRVADAVHQAHPATGALIQLQGDGLVGYEEGLGRHDGASGPALGQLVLGPLAHVGVPDLGKHQGVHEALDEGGFSGAHRSDDPDVNAASRTLGHVLKKPELFHAEPSPVAQAPACARGAPSRATPSPKAWVPAVIRSMIWTRTGEYDGPGDVARAPGCA